MKRVRDTAEEVPVSIEDTLTFRNWGVKRRVSAKIGKGTAKGEGEARCPRRQVKRMFSEGMMNRVEFC